MKPKCTKIGLFNSKTRVLSNSLSPTLVPTHFLYLFAHSWSLNTYYVPESWLDAGETFQALPS